VLPHLLATGCGALLEERSPGALARAVRSCLEDPLRYRTMSERGVRTARNYSLERWRDMIGEFMRRAWGPLAADA
jgi:hypothetical protein